MPAVVGTTRPPADELERIDAAARERGLPVFFAPNFAIGAVLMMRFAAQAAQLHAAARRSSSCTTTRSATRRRARRRRPPALIGGGRPIHSVRLPGLVAHQEVLFGGPGQLLTIRHDTISREAFVPGVLLALARLESCRPASRSGSTRCWTDSRQRAKIGACAG